MDRRTCLWHLGAWAACFGAGAALPLMTGRMAHAGMARPILAIPTGMTDAEDLSGFLGRAEGDTGFRVRAMDDPIEAVKRGQADVALGAHGAWRAASPALIRFGGSPGGLEPDALERWMRTGTGRMAWDALHARHGLSAHWIRAGAAMTVCADRALPDVPSIAGARLCVPATAEPVWRALSASPCGAGALSMGRVWRYRDPAAGPPVALVVRRDAGLAGPIILRTEACDRLDRIDRIDRIDRLPVADPNGIELPLDIRVALANTAATGSVGLTGM